MADELGNSGVPYNPVVIDTFLKGKQPFTPTLFEWLKIRGEKILRYNARVAAGTSDIYVVPAGYIFFLVSAYVSSTAQGLIFPSPSDGAAEILDTAAAGRISISYPLPVEFNEGVRIIIQQTGAGVTYAGVSGFIVKKDQMPQI